MLATSRLIFFPVDLTPNSLLANERKIFQSEKRPLISLIMTFYVNCAKRILTFTGKVTQAARVTTVRHHEITIVARGSARRYVIFADRSRICKM